MDALCEVGRATLSAQRIFWSPACRETRLFQDESDANQ
jgi:hypothetical protein